MKNFGLICVVFLFVLFGSCRKTNQPEPIKAIDELNQEAFDFRYKDIDFSKSKARQALLLIDSLAPDYYSGKAEAWNTLAYGHFLTSYFDSAKLYIDTIRSIREDYKNKEIEETISYITEARLMLRECRYADAFITYDSTITIFSGLKNKLKYNNCLPLASFNKERYDWAKSDYLLGNAVLDFYYRNTDLSSVLAILDEVERNKALHVDTTQLSVLYYTFAGSYEKAIQADVQNLYKAFDYVEKGLELMSDPLTRNDYQLANNYQIIVEILFNPGTARWFSGADSVGLKARLEHIKTEYLIGKYNWTPSETADDVFVLNLLKKTDALFGKYNDPYQNMVSNLFIADYYLGRQDTVTAKEYLHVCIQCDEAITERKGAARVWKRQLYNTLLKSLTPDDSIAEVSEWYDTYSEESNVIANSTQKDYNAQKGKIEAEAKAKRSLYVIAIFVIICIASLFLLYQTFNKNKKLKKARSNLSQRNNELEESRKDLVLLSKIGEKIVSTLEIGNDRKKSEFVDGVYREISGLQVVADLPDFTFILYLKGADNELQSYAKTSAGPAVELATHLFSELYNPAIGCFLNRNKELLCFNDWRQERDAYVRRVGIADNDAVLEDERSAQSRAFINLYSRKGEKIGVLSFQTTGMNAFKKPFILAIFEIIAEYIAVALDNAMQYEELSFVQQQLIEQKRMELLTYVVRGVSHELSQPLGSITQTLFDTMKDIDELRNKKNELSVEEYDRLTGNIQMDLRTISESKQAISDLVNSFRNMIRENVVDPETEFNLKQRIEDIVKIVKPSIKSNINLLIECRDDISIRSFALLFGQVITNLISNANQHAFTDPNDPRNTIRIVCKESGNDLIVQCIDNGVGIPENELDKLCQPFVSKKSSNMGLGLSLIRNIVEQYMKGEIHFSSDNGLTVTIVIPNCIIKNN